MLFSGTCYLPWRPPNKLVMSRRLVWADSQEFAGGVMPIYSKLVRAKAASHNAHRGGSVRISLDQRKTSSLWRVGFGGIPDEIPVDFE